MSKKNEKPVTTATKTETLLIVNPNSSSGSTGKNWNDFYLGVKEFFGENPEIVFTTKSGDGQVWQGNIWKKRSRILWQ